MNKEEILAKSRRENKGKDIVELEVHVLWTPTHITQQI